MMHFIGYAVVFATLFGSLAAAAYSVIAGRREKKREESRAWILCAERWDRKGGSCS